MGRWFRGLTAYFLVAMVAGCGAPPPPPPTVVNLTITATKDANGPAGGSGAPVMLRIYQLAGTNSFTNADFFQIFNHDTATLGTDLVHKDQLLLAPGTTKTLTLHPNGQVTALGFFAGYSAFATATWRATAPVPAHKTTAITVTVGASAVAVKSGG